MNQRFRSSGVDLPLFSLPGEYGIGSIGTEAKEFVDFLAKSGFSYWSRLPLNPTSFGDSPYSCYATIGLNHYFIDFNDLRDKGLLKRRDRANIDFGSDPRKIDYEKIYKSRIKLLKIAYNRFIRGKGDYQRGYISFLRKNQFTDYACYRVLKEINKDCAWKDFKDGYNEYTSAKLKAVRRNHPQKVDFYLWTQYIFLRQWEELKKYANSQGISIIGERSRYANYDSVDVYRHHNCFELNDELGKIQSVNTKMIKLDWQDEIALANMDALKEELVNMVRKKRDSGKDSFELTPEKANKLHDDRAYTACMASFALMCERRKNITQRKKPNNTQNLVNLLPIKQGYRNR